MRVLIYALIDPRDRRVRYVGRTVNRLRTRLREHVSCAMRGKGESQAKNEWILEVLSSGVRPGIVQLEEVLGDNYGEREKAWIARFKEAGADLLNCRDGGEGSIDGGYKIQWTDEARALLGKIADGRVAEMVGVTRKAIAYHRHKYGIAASFDKTRAVKPPSMKGINKIHLPPEAVAKLGTMPDYVLAALYGLNKTIIARRRKTLGIKSYAAATGNNGQYQKGNFPARWKSH